MKRFLFGFLAVLFIILNIIPYLHIIADQSMTDSQLKQVGAFALSSLITTGEATELDFSDYTDSDTDFLLALGELVVTGDPSGLIDCGLDWLGGEIDDAYDSAIQSIREWEYNMSPTLYYWFVDTQPPYELSPAYNNIRDLSQPLRRLLTPPDDDYVNPSPDPDFSFLNNTVDFTWYNTDILVYQSGKSIVLPNTPQNPLNPIDSSFITTSESNDFYYSNGLATSNLITIYILDNGININVSYDNFQANWRPVLGYNDLCYGFSAYGTSGNYLNAQSPNWYANNYPRKRTTFDSLSVCCNYIYDNFRHVNIYYNNEPWVLVSNNGPTYPIVIPDQLTIWNGQPLQYEFPSDTYLKLPDLTNIITNAINNSGVVMWSDIADVFVDVNGQTVVAVTKIVRNDYDNLYMEQYPYPAMLVGMTDQTKFNEHLLDNSHAYLSPIGTVVQETVNVLPSELVGVLAIGAILTIFAVIINRLLE